MNKTAISFGATRTLLHSLRNAGVIIKRPNIPKGEIDLGRKIITIGRKLDHPRATLFHETGHALDMLDNLKRYEKAPHAAAYDLIKERNANAKALALMQAANVPKRLQDHYKIVTHLPYRTHRADMIFEIMHETTGAPTVSNQAKNWFIAQPETVNTPTEQMEKVRIIDKILRRQDPNYLRNKRYVSKLLLKDMTTPHYKESSFKDNLEYAKYVTKHKANIVSPMVQMGLPLSQALVHDLSKYLPSEFKSYRDWFVGPTGVNGTKDSETHKRWRDAVEKHYARNMHHWKKRGLTVEQTPLKYRMESVADWYSVGKTIRPKGTKFPDFKTWYAQREASLPIDSEVRVNINKRLGLEKTSEVTWLTLGKKLVA